MQIKLTNKLEHKNIFMLNIVGISDFLMPHWEWKIQTPSWTAHMAHTFLEPASLPGNGCWRQENISITAQMVLTSLWKSRLPSSLPERVAAHHVRKSLSVFCPKDLQENILSIWFTTWREVEQGGENAGSLKQLDSSQENDCLVRWTACTVRARVTPSR